jgi:hypothetical protein
MKASTSFANFASIAEGEADWLPDVCAMRVVAASSKTVMRKDAMMDPRAQV